jgi:glycosyltransferase involved in cell wall biosynthesis
VVPEGVAAIFLDDKVRSVPKGFPLPDPFFLCAGSFNPRKNLVRVVEVFEQLGLASSHRLVIAGTPGWDSAAVLDRVSTSPARERIHMPGRVTDEELSWLYKNATAFLYVSLLEGFGLPILEAMACGCPVITSNLSSMPEVADEAALLVNPRNEQEIAHAMARVVQDGNLRKSLSARGKERAQSYRWSDCAQAVAEIYRTACRQTADARPDREQSSERNGTHSSPWEE